MNPLAIIQSRMESTRLPGKALKEIDGAPLTEHVVRRTHRAIPNPVLAIPDTPANDELEERAEDWPCHVVRGPEADVLRRFLNVLEQFPDAGPILRVTGDNPLISSRLMEQLRDRLGDADWVTWRWLPFGVGNNIFTRQSIEEARELATSERDREHVTLPIRRSDAYKKKVLSPPPDYRAPGLRLTVDTKEDLELIRRLHEEIDGEPFSVDSRDAINLLAKQPDLIDINRSIQQKHYPSRRSILHTMNRGKDWGSGHWIRFKALKRKFREESSLNSSLYGLLGDLTDPEDEPDGILHQSDDSLDGSSIKSWTRRAGARLVIQDVKHTGENLATSLKEEGARIIGFEDRGPGREFMDAVVDPNIYEDTLPDDTTPSENRYYGPDYALIDPRFRQHRREKVGTEIENVGLFFGGSDPAEIGRRFREEVAPEFPDLTFHSFGSPGTMTGDPSKQKNNVQFRGMVENPAMAFSEMDLMVISGGVTKFEVACLQMSAIIIPQNQEQSKNSSRFLRKNNIAWPICSPEKPESWITSLRKSKNTDTVQNWTQSTRGTVDGRGFDRLLSIIETLF